MARLMFPEVSATLYPVRMDEEQRQRAADYALRRMRDLGVGDDLKWLVVMTGLDPSTVRNFLAGKTWPWVVKRQAIEKALKMDPGTLDAVAREGLPDNEDPVKAAIERSALTESNRLRLIATYLDMLDDQEGRRTG